MATKYPTIRNCNYETPETETDVTVAIVLARRAVDAMTCATQGVVEALDALESLLADGGFQASDPIELRKIEQAERDVCEAWNRRHESDESETD